MFIQDFCQLFDAKIGLEVGGPSKIFQSEVPIYKWADRIDGVNFSSDTVWTKHDDPKEFAYEEGKIGKLYIREASDLIGISMETYDFLLASHVLEHCANCIKTLNEWSRILKKGGVMLLVLPRAELTFDHRRTPTPFKHFLEDVRNNVGEDDLNHFDEIMLNHDLSRDPLAGNLSNFTDRSMKNFQNRCFHHHVFNFSNLSEVLIHCNLSLLGSCFFRPFHQVVIARKP